jgi:hypothetical protein
LRIFIMYQVSQVTTIIKNHVEWLHEKNCLNRANHFQG